MVESVIVGGSLSTAYFDYLVLQALDLCNYPLLYANVLRRGYTVCLDWFYFF